MVLGRMFRERDGESLGLDSVVLAYWPVGRGGILAYGNLPEPWRQPGGGNAAEFLRNAIRSLHVGSPTRVEVFLQPGAPRLPPPALLPLAQRSLPGAPLLPHWGWQVPVGRTRGSSELLDPAEITGSLLRDSERAGADLLLFQVADGARGYPFPWAADDPIPAPPGWRGGSSGAGWHQGTLREVASLAHQRGFLVGAYLEPGLLPGGTPAEVLSTNRWFARQFLDQRRLGDAALDHVGLRTGVSSDLAELFRTFQPGLAGVYTGRSASPRGFVAVAHGSSVAGIEPSASHMTRTSPRAASMPARTA
jgi:hypothetical protein